MKARLPVAYVVEIDSGVVTLNLLDMHRGHLASHTQGISSVTEVGSLLGIDAGHRLLVLKVLAISFAEPREAHKAGIASSRFQAEPLRHLKGVIVGRIEYVEGTLRFVTDSLATPALGAEAFPLVDNEHGAILGQQIATIARITLGQNLRGGGQLIVGLENLISRHVAVLGSSGQGKSCFTAAVLQQIIKFPRAHIVIFDINGEYEDARAPLLAKGELKPRH